MIWVRTARTRSWIQVSEGSILHWVAVLSRRDRVRHSRGAQSRAVLLCSKRSQLSCSGIWSGCLLDATLWSHLGHIHAGGDSGADPRHAGELISLSWPGKALGFPRRKRLGDRIVWASLLRLLTQDRQKQRIYSSFFSETHTKNLQQHIIKVLYIPNQ